LGGTAVIRDSVPRRHVSDAQRGPLYAEFVRSGAKIDYGPCDQPYGCREFGTQDLDGHDIGFGQVMK